MGDVPTGHAGQSARMVGHQFEQAFGVLVPSRLLGAHLQRDQALAATGDEVLGPGGLDLALLHLEDAAPQRCGARVRHHAATAAAAVAGDPVVLQLDQLEAQRREDAPRRRFEPAPAHDLAWVVEGRVAPIFFTRMRPDVISSSRYSVMWTTRTGSSRAVPARGFPARRAVGVPALGQQHGLGADLQRRVDERARQPLLQLDIAVVEADVRRVVAALVHRPLHADAVAGSWPPRPAPGCGRPARPAQR